MKSANFKVELNKENIVFEVTGYGHGVGLSQYGANNLAKKGYNYEKIISHYYTGVNIKTKE